MSLCKGATTITAVITVGVFRHDSGELLYRPFRCVPKEKATPRIKGSALLSGRIPYLTVIVALPSHSTKQL